MNAEIVLVRQRQQGRLGGGAQTDLHGGAVVDQPGNVTGNQVGGFRLRRHAEGQDFLFVLHDDIHIVDMDKAPAQDPGHAGVNLGDNQIGRQGCRQGDVHRHPQAHPSEIIGRGHLDQGHMNGKLTGFKQPRHRRQVDGGDKPHISGQALGFGGPQIERADIEVVIFGFVGNEGQRGALQDQQPHHFDIGELRGCFGKFPDQRLGNPAGRTDKNSLSRLNQLNGIPDGAFFLYIIIRPVGRDRHSDPLKNPASFVLRFEKSKLPQLYLNIKQNLKKCGIRLDRLHSRSCRRRPGAEPQQRTHSPSR